MTPTRRLLPLALLAAALPAAGEEGLRPAPQPFGYERPVTPGGLGRNRLPVDGALLAGSSARSGAALLSDLRLFDAQGREVPYLLISPPRKEPQWVRGAILPIPQTKVASGFEADLGSLRRIDRLRVVGLPAPFLKRLRLEGSGDRARWTVLVAEGTLFDLPDEGLSGTEVAFPEGEHRWLRLAWNDAKSGRVPLPERVEARLAGSGGAAEPLLEPVPFERRESEPDKSRFRLRLPSAGLPIAAIEVAVGSGNVHREAAVFESRLAGGRISPFRLGAATLRRAERDDAAAAGMTVRISPPAEAELELVVEDGGNPPLDVAAVTAHYEGLPWIYFESPDGAPLTARFGAPGLSRPRYDLEAVRPAVLRRDGPAPAAAAWGESRTTAPDTGPRGAMPHVPAGAAIDLGGFRVSRPIPPGPPGLTALRLDAAALAVSPGLSDVRIATADGRQVPYLLETLGEPLVVRLPVPRKAEDPRPRSPGESGRLSFHRVELPFDRLPGARLELTTTARVFTRHVTLLRERLGGRPETAGTFPAVAASAWESADPERAAPPSSSTFLPAMGRISSFRSTTATTPPFPWFAPRFSSRPTASASSGRKEPSSPSSRGRWVWPRRGTTSSSSRRGSSARRRWRRPSSPHRPEGSRRRGRRRGRSSSRRPSWAQSSRSSSSWRGSSGGARSRQAPIGGPREVRLAPPEDCQW
jgi:hypothetical protein